MSTTPADSLTRFRMRAGLTTILIGFGTFALSRVIDSGFVHGLFQGATVALMVLGAFLVGSARWPRTGPQDADDGRHWLPSRDGAIDRDDSAS